MKKLFSLISIMAVALTLMAGCGNTQTAEVTPQAAEPQATDAGTQTNNQEAVAVSTMEAESVLSGTISTNGSTSMEKVVASLIEAFTAQHPDVTITLDMTGSGSGITAAMEGTADIGLSSRNLKESETGLNATVIALDGIAIIVNNDNPINDLSLEQIKALFIGEIANWSEVGGSDNPVAVIGREAGSGTRDGFESIVGVVDECVYDQELNSGGAVITAVASNVNAIGYTSLSAVSDQVKSVDVEGVVCSEANVLNGSYVLQRPFLMITKSGVELSPEVKAFIEFALSSETTEIVSNAGVVQAR